MFVLGSVHLGFLPSVCFFVFFFRRSKDGKTGWFGGSPKIVGKKQWRRIGGVNTPINPYYLYIILYYIHGSWSVSHVIAHRVHGIGVFFTYMSGLNFWFSCRYMCHSSMEPMGWGGKMVVPLGWRAPSCLTPPRSPFKGDISSKDLL